MIEATNLSKRFGDIEAVRDVSFVARDGEITGILGANGAGKSTCLRMLYGVLTPDSGHACIDGLDIGGETSKARAHLTPCNRNDAAPSARLHSYCATCYKTVTVPSGLESTVLAVNTDLRTAMPKLRSGHCRRPRRSPRR